MKKFREEIYTIFALFIASIIVAFHIYYPYSWLNISRL